jgi:hypothetical protein
MLLIKVRNQQFLRRPWLVTVYTVIGGAWPIYLAGPVAQSVDILYRSIADSPKFLSFLIFCMQDYPGANMVPYQICQEDLGRAKYRK